MGTSNCSLRWRKWNRVDCDDALPNAASDALVAIIFALCCALLCLLSLWLRVVNWSWFWHIPTREEGMKWRLPTLMMMAAVECLDLTILIKRICCLFVYFSVLSFIWIIAVFTVDSPLLCRLISEISFVILFVIPVFSCYYRSFLSDHRVC